MLNSSCGGPPVIVTASLILTVSSTVLPALMSPSPATIPSPETVTSFTTGAVVSICKVPSSAANKPAGARSLPAVSRTDEPFVLKLLTIRSAVSCVAPTV